MDANQYRSQLIQFIPKNKEIRPEFEDYYQQPILSDDSATTGFDAHYIYHVAWAIGKINKSPPLTHIDFASSLYFCTAISSVVPTTFVDYRPVILQMKNLTCLAGDLTDSSQWNEKSFPSVSCMHVVEHIGLGRYGDQLDINGDIKTFENKWRKLAIFSYK